MKTSFATRLKTLLISSAAILASCSSTPANKSTTSSSPDLIVYNAKVFSHANGFQEAFAVKNGVFMKIGKNDEIMKLKSDKTQLIDAAGRTIIPGLTDTHAHPIRAGLNYNLELRWDGLKSLKEGLQMIKEQAARTPEGQWVRVVGGWSPHQFKENRFPTIEELNEASPNRPVFVMYLYSKAFINKAAIQALNYTKDTKFPGGVVELDKKGNPTGVLTAKPNAMVLYKTLAAGPKLSSRAEERNSTILYFQELSKMGLTTVIDAGGGGFFFPEDHRIAKELFDKGKLAVRIPFFLFAPVAGKELEDYKRWTAAAHPATLHEIEENLPYHLMGGGENLTSTAADFEDFMEPRPDLPPNMEAELKPILKLIFKHQWIFRIHATYDESIGRILNVVEEIKKEGGPFPDRFIIDHAETVSLKNLKRIQALGGGISVQDRMAFQGEEFVKQYGAKKAETTPPVADMLSLGIPVGSGTDATRVSSFNPWISLYWHVSGKTVGGLKHMSDRNRLSREQALYLMTKGAAWFSKEEQFKGDIREGEFADFALLNKDYFSVPEEKIKEIHSDLTVLSGRVMYGEKEFSTLVPPAPPALPKWSPVNFFGGYQYNR
ncbi:amidohydrolase [Bdellovibrio sp. HCB2-146]|uniref:amidohydrolase n=1 Tax=Bdellovibrio sp. HCB2-146 TaxID=3394362 RepID=UPI0039BCDC19